MTGMTFAIYTKVQLRAERGHVSVLSATRNRYYSFQVMRSVSVE